MCQTCRGVWGNGLLPEGTGVCSDHVLFCGQLQLEATLPWKCLGSGNAHPRHMQVSC